MDISVWEALRTDGALLYWWYLIEAGVAGNVNFWIISFREEQRISLRACWRWHNSSGEWFSDSALWLPGNSRPPLSLSNRDFEVYYEQLVLLLNCISSMDEKQTKSMTSILFRSKIEWKSQCNWARGLFLGFHEKLFMVAQRKTWNLFREFALERKTNQILHFAHRV